MTLNLSHWPVFPTSPGDDNLVSSMRFDDYFLMEGIQDDSLLFNLDFSDVYEHEPIDILDFSDVYEREPIDILELLPADPFNMDIGATFTAMSGWFDIFGMDALHVIWSNAMSSPLQQGSTREGKGLVDTTCNTHSTTNSASGYAEVGRGDSIHSGGDPHEALLYVLGYLDVYELLSVARVCKSLHSVVHSDPLLWRNVCIDQPLNEKIDDDTLFSMTSRAQGNLQCLSLIKCSGVTDDGLKRVLDCNMKLEKLIVPDCTKLTIEGILRALKDLHSLGASKLKHIQIGGRYDVRPDHFNDLKMLLGIDTSSQNKEQKPRIYHGGQSGLPYDDECDIDIEICPRCENPRLVYDCPVHKSRVEEKTRTCRACTICIPRCVECGRCVNDGEYVETFCLDIVCLHCSKLQPQIMGALSKNLIVE